MAHGGATDLAAAAPERDAAMDGCRDRRQRGARHRAARRRVPVRRGARSSRCCCNAASASWWIAGRPSASVCGRSCIDLHTAEVVKPGSAWWRELFFCGDAVLLRDADGNRLYVESWLWDADADALLDAAAFVEPAPPARGWDSATAPLDSPLRGAALLRCRRRVSRRTARVARRDAARARAASAARRVGRAAQVGHRLAAAPVRCRLRGPALAEGIRRPRRVADRAADLLRRDSQGARAVRRCELRRHAARGSDAHRRGQRRTEGRAPAEDPARRRSVVPGVLGAERRFRPCVAAHACRARRRRLRPQRAEDLVFLRTSRRRRRVPRPHRSRGAEAQRHLVADPPDGPAGDRGPPDQDRAGSSEFCEVFLTDVRVPVANRVGAENDGWRVTNVTLEVRARHRVRE